MKPANVPWLRSWRRVLVSHKSVVTRPGKYRLSGKPAAQVNSEMLARLNERIEQRRRYESALVDPVS